MARILGGCAPALDYSQEAKKLWEKLGEAGEKSKTIVDNLTSKRAVTLVCVCFQKRIKLPPTISVKVLMCLLAPQFKTNGAVQLTLLSLFGEKQFGF